jgi:hypothetical protein
MRCAAALLLACGALATSAACSSTKSGGPGDQPPTAGASTPGPAPLRRLTNTEYLNALHDLFPALNPTLPALPEDLTVDGFDNNAASQAPSDILIARYETIANFYAQGATATTSAVASLVGCSDWSTQALATTCAKQLVTRVGLRVFRRPLTSDEQARYLAHFQSWQSAVDFPGAVQLTLGAMLQSPQFIYRPEPLPPTAKSGTVIPVDPYEMATRLSFFLWESVPDDALLQAAADSELSTDAQLTAQTRRMLADDRAKRVFWDFHRQWLGLDQILLAEGATRTPQVDPKWTAATQASAYEESQLFVQNTLAQGGTLRDLLTSRRA